MRRSTPTVLDSVRGPRRAWRVSWVRERDPHVLIADLRGYTRFSDEHGDEEASRLAQWFAELVRAAVRAHGGEVVELRGDEALCSFGSARDALRAAVELQRRSREPGNGEPALALAVGIGLDAGEAVPTEGGYRGRALNVAARLCSLAGPGQILASETVANLAGRHDGATFETRRPARAKGLDEPVRLVEVIPDEPLPALSPPSERPRRQRASRRTLIVFVGLAVLLAVAAALTAVLLTRDEAVAVARNSVAVIDPQTNEIVAAVPVGDGPTQIALGNGTAWVLNRDASTISRIDTATRELDRTLAVDGTPAGLATGAGAVWVGDSVNSAVLQLDPASGRTLDRVDAPPLGEEPGSSSCPCPDAGPVAVEDRAVWFLSGHATLTRIDAASLRVADQQRLPGSPGLQSNLAVGVGAVWSSLFVTAREGLVVSVDRATNRVAERISVPPQGQLAVGPQGLWVTELDGDRVWQLDRGADAPLRTIAVGSRPIDVALGAGSVWVANSGDGTVSRIDPASGEVTTTIRVGGSPQGIAVGEGAVWVAVG